MVKKFTDGPVVGLTVRPNGPPGFGRNLAQWFLLCLFVSFVAAAPHALARLSRSGGHADHRHPRLRRLWVRLLPGFDLEGDPLVQLVPGAPGRRGVRAGYRAGVPVVVAGGVRRSPLVNQRLAEGNTL
jgi:hypothetical protein